MTPCESGREDLSLHRGVAMLQTEELLSALCLELLGPRAKAELVGHARALLHREIDNLDVGVKDRWMRALPSTERKCDRSTSSSTVASLAVLNTDDVDNKGDGELGRRSSSWWLAAELLPHVLSYIVEVSPVLGTLRRVCRAFDTATRLPQCYQGSHIYLSSGACRAVDPEAHWMKVLELPLEQAADITISTLGVPYRNVDLLEDAFGIDKIVRHMSGFARDLHGPNVEVLDDRTVRRRDEYDPFHAIVLGNAPLKSLPTGEKYFAFRISKTSRRHFGGGVTIALSTNPPLSSVPEKLRGSDISLAIVQKGEVFVYGEKIDVRGDTVGLRVDEEGCVTLYRNGRIVPSTSPLQIPSLSAPPPQLLPTVGQPDIYAMLHVKANTAAITLLPDHEPPEEDKFWISSDDR
ncbi:hypothetical protein FOL47_001727 [Perkinsus chesapeaki]|uniref:Uncharacterized protein n=1 Tax=Perkinsus chesapeaki TaxID=330153 RepID=A0A7J6MHH1_PERCH|nr:hypothetical protein FOL47_001727 [Perkinsus chesapeaki]